MITVADCLIEDYIHTMKLKNFCFEHKMPVSENKADLFKRVLDYAGDDMSSVVYQETYNWFLDTIKAGSKELCLKRIYIPDDILNNIEQIIIEKYSECSRKDLLSFKNLDEFEMIDFDIQKNEENLISKISFVYSRMVLEGDKELEIGHKIIYPLYIDIYVDKCFIVGRYKTKTTIYTCSENNIIYKQNRFKPLDRVDKVIKDLEKKLGFQEMDINPKQKFRKMLYKLYQKYSFTPVDIQTKINAMLAKRNDFVDEVFEILELNGLNKKKAKMDLDIFLEKYISINGNMEKVFKEDREAYLIKITSDDVLQMTRIDTASTGKKPLQCSDVFFDGKKSILNTKECKILHLCYNRKKGYLNSYTVQMSALKGYGIVKMYYVPEEEDIQYVLQTIFENY